MPPQVAVTEQSGLEVECDALVVGAFSTEDGPRLSPPAAEADSRLDGQLSAYLERVGFKAKQGDVVVVPTLGRTPASSIAICGLGPASRGTNPSSIRKDAGSAARHLAEFKQVVLCLHEDEAGATAAAEGFLLGGYRYVEFKSDPQPSRVERLLVPGASKASVDRGVALADATTLARDLTNAPPSALTPEILADRCREVADVAGLDCEIFDENQLKAEGFGGLLGVGRGSQNPPRLIRLHYSPAQPGGRIALVGKGVTFDSGGLSLKDAKNMEQMKTDMGGAAAVIGAMSGLTRLGVRCEVVGLVPATENLPGKDAIKPGDVLRHRDGKTTEVLNTDAEGRLILADALAYASEQKPDAIVDLATLTGAIVVALGAKRIGLFANDDHLAEALLSAAQGSGERLWRMPLDDDFTPMLSSEVADLVNTAGSRYGGALFAARFLSEFVADGIPWAHLDIAGPARADRDYEEVPKGGTGTGVRTLLAWLETR